MGGCQEYWRSTQKQAGQEFNECNEATDDKACRKGILIEDRGHCSGGRRQHSHGCAQSVSLRTSQAGHIDLSAREGPNRRPSSLSVRDEGDVRDETSVSMAGRRRGGHTQGQHGVKACSTEWTLTEKKPSSSRRDPGTHAWAQRRRQKPFCALNRMPTRKEYGIVHEADHNHASMIFKLRYQRTLIGQ